MLKSFCRSILIIICNILYRVEVKGIQSEYPKKLLVIANHQSFLDGLLVGLYLPIHPVFVVHTSVLDSWLFRLVLSLVDHIAVDTTSPMAMKKVIRLMETGRSVVIFPEGRITTTGSLMLIEEGPAFLAAKTGAPILPVCLEGPRYSTFSKLSGENPRQWFPKISVNLNPLQTIEMPIGYSAKIRRQRVAEEMRKIMQKMIFDARAEHTIYQAFCETISLYGRNRKILVDVRLDPKTGEKKPMDYTYSDILKAILLLGRKCIVNTQIGENIGVLMPNVTSNIGLLLGLSAKGRVPALLNYTSGVNAMQSACIAANIKTIITSRSFIKEAKIGDKIDALTNVNIIYLEDVRSSITNTDKIWYIFQLLHHRAFEVPVKASKPAFILFTSGSEGKPKGVVLSHNAILANIHQIRSVMDLSVEDKILNALPMFHSFGLTAGTLLPILSGAKLVLYPSPLHYRIIPSMAYAKDCTVLFGTSTFLGNYAKFSHPYKFYSLRYVVAGAEKLSETVKQTWADKFGIRIFEGYGATETAPVMAVNTRMAYKPGTVGQFLPGMEYKLVKVPGIENGGMLHVKGPNVMSGYLKFDKPGLLQEPESDVGKGWYETGDIVHIDEEAFVKIVGRVKRFAKIAGEMVSLEVVEKIALIASGTKMHAATARPDANKGEQLVLFTTDSTLTREHLIKAAKDIGSSELAVPRVIKLVQELPLLGTGKTDYVRLKQMAEEI